jgi:hypothetical protein
MKNVAKDLRDHYLFADIDRETFDQKWKRMKKDVSKRFAISFEGANLSGFDEDSVSELEKLCITLIEDEMKTKIEKDAHKEAKIKKNNTMLSFESSIISSRERLTTPCFTSSDEKKEEKKDSGGSTSAGTDLEIVRELMKGRDNNKEKKLELEKERIELERRRIAAQEEQNACMNRMLVFMMQQANSNVNNA